MGLCVATSYFRRQLLPFPPLPRRRTQLQSQGRTSGGRCLTWHLRFPATLEHSDIGGKLRETLRREF